MPSLALIAVPGIRNLQSIYFYLHFLQFIFLSTGPASTIQYISQLQLVTPPRPKSTLQLVPGPPQGPGAASGVLGPAPNPAFPPSVPTQEMSGSGPGSGGGGRAWSTCGEGAGKCYPSIQPDGKSNQLSLAGWHCRFVWRVDSPSGCCGRRATGGPSRGRRSECNPNFRDQREAWSQLAAHRTKDEECA